IKWYLFRSSTIALLHEFDQLTCPQQITHLLALQLQIPLRNLYENIWTSILSDVEFREVTDLMKVDKRKIAACDGKTLTPLQTAVISDFMSSTLLRESWFSGKLEEKTGQVLALGSLTVQYIFSI
uniref:Transcription initiation factor IIA gamma subunit C-terminal domain-containing protein n=1 Tax=Anser brachyrhynchus TaxID=132585 RepID=A0A8B9I3I9_9AVES